MRSEKPLGVLERAEEASVGVSALRQPLERDAEVAEARFLEDQCQRDRSVETLSGKRYNLGSEQRVPAELEEVGVIRDRHAEDGGPDGFELVAHRRDLPSPQIVNAITLRRRKNVSELEESTAVLRDPSRWIVNLGDENAPTRLFAFGHAGAGAALFRPWPAFLGGQVLVSAVRLPGRENRITEPLRTDLNALVGELGAVVGPHLDRPFAVLGLCSGAFIAFELARWLNARGLPRPSTLFVVAQHAPQVAFRGPAIHNAPRRMFLAELRRMGGTTSQVLDDEEMMSLLEPAIRADCKLVETYVYKPGAPLAVDHVSAFTTRADPTLSIGEVVAWREHASRRFTIREFDAADFFGASAWTAVASRVTCDLVHSSSDIE